MAMLLSLAARGRVIVGHGTRTTELQLLTLFEVNTCIDKLLDL